MSGLTMGQACNARWSVIARWFPLTVLIGRPSGQGDKDRWQRYCLRKPQGLTCFQVAIPYLVGQLVIEFDQSALWLSLLRIFVGVGRQTQEYRKPLLLLDFPAWSGMLKHVTGGAQFTTELFAIGASE